MAAQHKPTPTNIDTEKRGAVHDVAILVAGAATYEALKMGAKAGVQHAKDKMSAGDKSKD
jgi:hypothetical protein